MYFHKWISNTSATDGKRPLNEKDDDNHTPSGPSGGKEEKTIKASTSDPESGWFRKGDHKKVVTHHIWEPYLEMCEDIRHTYVDEDTHELKSPEIWIMQKSNKRYDVIKALPPLDR